VTANGLLDESIDITDSVRAEVPTRSLSGQEDDPSLVARGVLMSLAFSLPFWLVVATLVWWALH
jgi:hypothetical protein